MSSYLSRRDFLASTSAFMAAGLACNLLPNALFAAKDEHKRKNILFIIGDDLKPALNCYGNKQVISPNIDRLARTGIIFDNAFCQYPVCGPSRQSLLSGMRPDTIKVYDNRLVKDEEMMGKPSLPKYLKGNGYYTVSIGKIYHNPMIQDLGAWSETPRCLPTHVYKLQKNIDKIAEIEKEGVAQGKSSEELKTKKFVACTEDADVTDDEYFEGQLCNITIEKLKERTTHKDQPFFMALGFYRPHYPFTAPKKYWDFYKREHLNLADNPFRPKNAKYIMDKNYEPQVYGDVPKTEPFDEELERRMIHGYYACVSYIDAQIGKVLDNLQQVGLADNTIIVLIGDNGFHLGDHGLWGKFTHFEDTARVPMIVSIPDMTNVNKHTPVLTEYVDIYPSLCDLNGLPIPRHCEGISVVPVLKKPAINDWKNAAFTTFHIADGWATSMRTPRYRFTKWINHATQTVMDLELYDLAVDPKENENIASYPENKTIVAGLEKMLDAGWKAAKPKI